VSRRSVLVAGLAAVAVAAGCSSGGDEQAAPPSNPAPTSETAEPAASLDDCAAVAELEDARACYATALWALVGGADDPASALEEIAVAAYSEPSRRLLGECHGLMHTVGREYAGAHAVTLENLMSYLPQTNEPGCSAGFAHGLVTGVAPQIDLGDPAASAAVCDETDTRYRRYSCIHGFGHAFMRLVREDLETALELCSALGAEAPDCSQGAFHDYWFAAIGADDTTPPETLVVDPRELCGAQAEEFVRPCWYRAFIDDRPDEPIESAADILDLCEGLAGLQRQACITAASVVGPPDPRVQLSLCAELEGEEAVSCIRGTKVQNLIVSPPEDLVALIRQCDGFPAETRPACYRWLGKVLAVLTDGEFEQYGCPAAPDAGARRACVRGANESDEPLVTFS
jgi:hypothetical protein